MIQVSFEDDTASQYDLRIRFAMDPAHHNTDQKGYLGINLSGKVVCLMSCNLQPGYFLPRVMNRMQSCT